MEDRALTQSNRTEVANWLGALAGLLALVPASPVVLAPGIKILFAFVGGGICFVFVRKLLVRPQRFPVKCDKCRVDWVLTGARGCKSKNDETFEFTVQMDSVNAFLLAKRKIDGSIQNERFEYRALDAGKTPATRTDITHLVSITKDEGHEQVLVRLPASLSRGRRFEIVNSFDSTNCFDNDRESVGKRPLFPVARLEFGLRFTECTPVDITATRYEGEVAVDNSPLALNLLPTEGGGRHFGADWASDNVSSTERYTVEWKWGQ